VIQQRVRDAQLGGQLAHLRIEPAASEELGGASHDLLLTLARIEPAARHWACSAVGRARAGFRGIDHLVNSAQIVERLLNKPHPDKPWRVSPPTAPKTVVKSPAFDYVRAESPQQVFELLHRHGDDARVLAGGQTLLATLNMRLSQPALLVDINALDALHGIAVAGNVLRIGALTRHVEIEESALVARHAPLLAQAAPHIAHRAIRNLGTFGGSLAYADPAAEWPACVLALAGTLVLAGARGERRVAAADFFRGLYTTALAPGELLVACEVPLAAPDERQHFSELARRQGDYAVAGLAARALRSSTGSLRDVRLAFLSLADRPIRARHAEAALQAGPLDDARLAEAEAALRSELEPFADLTHSAAAKKQLAATLLRRAVAALTAT
jgi:carbon-monoxide dehydrogenase medium subunit